MNRQVAAHALATSSLTVALMQTLVLRGVLTAQQVRETIETALLQVETAQANAEDKLSYQDARDLLEASLDRS